MHYCQCLTLRGCITLVIVVQCLLVIVYLDITKSGTDTQQRGKLMSIIRRSVLGSVNVSTASVGTAHVPATSPPLQYWHHGLHWSHTDNTQGKKSNRESSIGFLTVDRHNTQSKSGRDQILQESTDRVNTQNSRIYNVSSKLMHVSAPPDTLYNRVWKYRRDKNNHKNKPSTHPRDSKQTLNTEESKQTMPGQTAHNTKRHKNKQSKAKQIKAKEHSVINKQNTTVEQRTKMGHSEKSNRPVKSQPQLDANSELSKVRIEKLEIKKEKYLHLNSDFLNQGNDDEWSQSVNHGQELNRDQELSAGLQSLQSGSVQSVQQPGVDNNQLLNMQSSEKDKETGMKFVYSMPKLNANAIDTKLEDNTNVVHMHGDMAADGDTVKGVVTHDNVNIKVVSEGAGRPHSSNAVNIRNSPKSNNYDFLKSRVFQLPSPESTVQYFLPAGPGRTSTCYRDGTQSVDAVTTTPYTPYKINILQGANIVDQTIITSECRCKDGWHGKNCSIPDLVYFSSGLGMLDTIKPRTQTRRIINALAFNVEFELLEARFNELDTVVDVFIIFESNYSNYGEAKPLRLLERLKEGYLAQFHHKIIYIMRHYFPHGGHQDGWKVDEHMRTFIGREGLSRLGSTRPDDLFIYTDADELPSKEALQFLRVHEGYPEPFGFSLRWSVFGFFWRQFEPTRVYAGCTLAMMRYVFQYSAYELRTGDYFTKHQALIQAYTKSGGNVYEWYLGETGYPAGWHCSWCLPAKGIQIKLKSAINADFPRWGDYPEKLKLDYISSLVQRGVWFDDVMHFDSLSNWTTDTFYAPSYLLQNFNTYKVLLDLPNSDSPKSHDKQLLD